MEGRKKRVMPRKRKIRPGVTVIMLAKSVESCEPVFERRGLRLGDGS